MKSTSAEPYACKQMREIGNSDGCLCDDQPAPGRFGGRAGCGSAWDRVIVYISLCHVDNHIRRFKRPEWIAHRDFTPIECLADNCLTAADR